jgi:hypothetical protein
MDIIVLSIIAGLICAFGLYLASRDTRPSGAEDEHHHA